MPIQAKSRDLPPLMHEAAEAAWAALQRGDMEEYDRQKKLIDALGRLYHGFGTTEDMLEYEKLKQGPLQQIANAGKWVAIGAGALLLLPYLTKLRR